MRPVRIPQGWTVVMFIAFILSWFYRDMIHIPWIDPLLLTRDPGPETAMYWDIKHFLNYLMGALPWAILAGAWPVRNPYPKMLFMVIAAAHLMAAADLLLSGNIADTAMEPMILMGAAMYGHLCNVLLWSAEPAREEIRPGRAYLIAKPPRTVLEWIGTILRPRWAGTVEIYADGYRYHFSRKSGQFVRQHAPLYSPPNGSSVVEVPIAAEEIGDRAGRFIGSHWWPWFNCFVIARRITKKNPLANYK